jgi:hypothetical protein
MRSVDGAVRRGGDFDHWDLEARSGMFTTVRALLGIEEHGTGRQLIRVRLWPRAARLTLVVLWTLGSALVLSAAARAWLVCGVILLTGVVLALSAFNESEGSVSALAAALGSAAGTKEFQELQPRPELTPLDTA